MIDIWRALTDPDIHTPLDWGALGWDAARAFCAVAVGWFVAALIYVYVYWPAVNRAALAAVGAP